MLYRNRNKFNSGNGRPRRSAPDNSWECPSNPGRLVVDGITISTVQSNGGRAACPFGSQLNSHVKLCNGHQSVDHRGRHQRPAQLPSSRARRLRPHRYFNYYLTASQIVIFGSFVTFGWIGRKWFPIAAEIWKHHPHECNNHVDLQCLNKPCNK